MLTGVGLAAPARPRPHHQARRAHSIPATTTAPSIFVANPTGYTVSVYPPGSNGNAPSLATNPGLATPNGIARDAAGNLYVADPVGGEVAVFAAGASGAPNPTATITGANTGLTYPTGVALDATGNIYVANAGSSTGGTDSVLVFPAGSNGDAVPSATITGSATGLSFPSAIILDSSGNIYVANQGSEAGGADSITVYAAGASGDVAPINTIAGANTGLHTPAGIALDSNGDLWVANIDFFGGDQYGSVEMFPAGASGDYEPPVAIYGSCSGMDMPQGVAVDASGNIYVANSGQLMSDPNVSVYPAGSSNGCATASAVIAGAATTLAQPAGLLLDANLNLYVADYYNASIDVFAAGANGNVAPTLEIADPNTGLDYPMGVAVGSTGKICVANAGSQDGGFDSVTVYAAGSNADAAPIATIGANGATPDNTGLNFPDAITVAPAGGIWVATALGANGNGSILVFPPNANGNVFPEWFISGPDTGLNDPVGLVIGSGGGLHVLNASGGPDGMGSITTYAFGVSGDAAPAAIISGNSKGDQTGFNYPSGLAIDGGDNLYVTNDGSASGGMDSVTVYAAGSNGDVAPMATISGPDTQLNLPSGVAVDSSGNIYVTNDGSLGGGADTITVYPPGGNGDVAPTAVISGDATDLSEPAGIALGVE